MKRRLEAACAPYLRAYAAVLFCDSPRVGAWFALVTLWSPRAAVAGAVCLLASALWARLLALSAPGAPHLVNALLSGLFIGAFHALDWVVLCWVAVLALFVTLISHWLVGRLWQTGRLPLLSLPFVLACWLVTLLLQVENAAAMLPAPLSGDAGVVFGSWVDRFFSALGWLLLTPYPWAGAMLFLGLLLASRYLAILALSGYAAGQSALLVFGHAEASIVVGYNFMLAAMALGGIFTIPGWASFLMAVAGGAVAGWLGAALSVLLAPFHLPLLTLPFLLAVYLWLGALASRSDAGEPKLTLESPQSPELAYERMRLAQVRGCITGSQPVFLPVYGEWRVSQGFSGPYTHRAPWQHALDFDIVENWAGEQSNHSGNGMSQQQYFCFGAPVVAPVAGQVAALRDDLPDVLPGEADTLNNWGNYVLLRGAAGEHVLLSHLRQHSLRVRSGEWVEVNQPVAACGSSGRAPQPHLHLHVQQDNKLGSPTRPFHLVNILHHASDQKREFHLHYRPEQGKIISAASRDEGIAGALHLYPGLVLRYRLRRVGVDGSSMHELRNELTLLGQSRLVSDSGASVACEETQMVAGYYDRRGGADRLLDMWILALGLTPFSAAADHWQDAPSLYLLPLGVIRRAIVSAPHPLGAGCISHYQRVWDEAAGAWRQQGSHQFSLLPGISWHAETIAWITPGEGVVRLTLQFGGQHWEAASDGSQLQQEIAHAA